MPELLVLLPFDQVAVGRLLPQSKLFLLGNEVYYFNTYAYNFQPHALSDMLKDSTTAFVRMNQDLVYDVYKDGVAVTQTLCTLVIQSTRRHRYEFIIPYYWTLKRIPGLRLYYHNLMWRIIRVQRFIRKVVGPRMREKRFLLAAGCHYSSSESTSLLSTLSPDVMRNIISHAFGA